ncbi:RNA polymerase sigma factor [Aquimarina sp. AU119]|uniref:RNA polymerase sigma factor n=1 Tax=Aquimarina sp. AU119 TaxID=2108528 RepID=UPI000D696527|nr:sigma-70 family RNA polymerase sigma factor [Aquimarina sp. AU119]
MIEEQILILLKKGDSQTLKTIYQEYRDAFLHFAKRYDIATEDVVDVYQDAIIVLRENAIQGKIVGQNSSIKTYLFGIGKFMIYKKLRASKKMIKVEDQSFFENEETGQLLSYETTETNKQQQLVQQALKKISAKCKKVLVLFYSQGYSIEEIMIAEQYENKNVVKSQKSRCLKSLKKLINPNI